ncbi:MAG TPA: GWxTD domain-containing protein [Thermoanaerobaculia bacterium]|nr:GWxTD domain-containing protein [Thermoanaerobaculia bacterium]
MTFSGASRTVVLAGLLALGCGSTASRNPVDITNPFLGPEYTGWLVGAVSRLATPQEIQAFLAIQDDEKAREFVEAFWAKRDPNPDKPGNPIREAFEDRAAYADKAFSESGIQGRRTDRGAIFILYGTPSKIDHEVPPVPGASPLEVWIYEDTKPAGLDGRKPGTYRFIRRGDLTVLYSPGQQRPDPRLRDRPGMPPDVP